GAAAARGQRAQPPHGHTVPPAVRRQAGHARDGQTRARGDRGGGRCLGQPQTRQIGRRDRAHELRWATGGLAGDVTPGPRPHDSPCQVRSNGQERAERLAWGHSRVKPTTNQRGTTRPGARTSHNSDTIRGSTTRCTTVTPRTRPPWTGPGTSSSTRTRGPPPPRAATGPGGGTRRVLMPPRGSPPT